MNIYKEVLEHQKSYYKTKITYKKDIRINTLKNLRAWIHSHDDLIVEALNKDLGKSEGEAYMTEIGMALSSISFALKNIKKIIRKHRTRTPLHEFLSKSYTLYEPYGNVLIISPWNYPFLLSIEPLVGAVAAGNCIILKPSEYSKHTSALIRQMIEDVFDSGHVCVIEGDSEVSSELLKLNFDYIFFTGSAQVGQLVYQAAAKHLTPVTLELGGKSPCIISDSIPLKTTVKRIIFGKFLNAGQTCVAPDYILVQEQLKFFLYDYIDQFIHEFFGDNPLESENLCKIINQKHFNRLIHLLDNQDIILGGHYDTKTLKIAPTIIENVDLNSPIMKEEIFGPILPIITYKNIDEVINYINKQDKPLALYLFSDNKIEQTRILTETSFGGGCINDTINHLSNQNLPFGGVGLSGIGHYHGKYTYETFSHKKSIMHKSIRIDTPLRYYPINSKIMKKFLK